MTSDYLRRQAERCLQWASDCFDLRAAERLRLLATEFLNEAERLEFSTRIGDSDNQPNDCRMG